MSDDAQNRRDLWRKVGLAGVILLAPGGFVLGATLLADRYWRQRQGNPAPGPAATDPDRPTDAVSRASGPASADASPGAGPSPTH